MIKTRARKFGALVVGLALVAGACGGSDDAAEEPAEEPAAEEAEAPAEEAEAPAEEEGITPIAPPAANCEESDLSLIHI